MDDRPLVSGLQVYEDGLRAASGALRARWEDGRAHRLPVGRWLDPAGPEDEAVLRRAASPVLDVGCGPGRHVLALHRRGIVALGVDVSPVAVRLARRRGAPAVERSVFSRVPLAGSWATALLLDGNIGIGGDPSALLRRVVALLRPGGLVLAELEPPGAPSGTAQIRIEGPAARSEPFPWARVGVDTVEGLGHEAGLRLVDVWPAADRWFAELAVAAQRSA